MVPLVPRYRLQTVRSLAGLSLMLRLLWACLRWDDMAVKPSAAVGTTRTGVCVCVCVCVRDLIRTSRAQQNNQLPGRNSAVLDVGERWSCAPCGVEVTPEGAPLLRSVRIPIRAATCPFGLASASWEECIVAYCEM